MLVEAIFKKSYELTLYSDPRQWDVLFLSTWKLIFYLRFSGIARNVYYFKILKFCIFYFDFISVDNFSDQNQRCSICTWPLIFWYYKNGLDGLRESQNIDFVEFSYHAKSRKAKKMHFGIFLIVIQNQNICMALKCF